MKGEGHVQVGRTFREQIGPMSTLEKPNTCVSHSPGREEETVLSPTGGSYWHRLRKTKLEMCKSELNLEVT